MSFILLLLSPYLFPAEMGGVNMLFTLWNRGQKRKLWGKIPTTSVHANISKPRSCTFNVDGTVKASILTLIPIYVIIRHGRINMSKCKLTLTLNCGPVINHFDFESLSVDFRFCNWYS